VRADDDELVALSFPGDLGDGVVRHAVALVEHRADVEAKPDRLSCVDETHEPVVVLGEDDHGGDLLRPGVDGVAAARDAKDAAVARADFENAERTLSGEKFVERVTEGDPAAGLLVPLVDLFLGRDREVPFRLQLVVAVAAERRLRRRLDYAQGRDEHELVFELSLELGQFFGSRCHEVHRLSLGGAFRAGCPGLRDRGHASLARAGEIERAVRPRPAAPELERLETRIRETRARQRVARPLVRDFHRRRSGQATPDPIGQVSGVRHHLRAVQPFVPDARDEIEIDRFRGMSGERDE